MKVIVNKEEKEFKHLQHVLDLVQELGLKEKTGIAIAVNMQIIAKGEWAEYPIKENDNITIITASQGG
jgi:sulfur carrier protein